LPSGRVLVAGGNNSSNRADANHRYLTDGALRSEMVKRGWTAEGDGPELVVMCAPQQSARRWHATTRV